MPSKIEKSLQKIIQFCLFAALAGPIVTSTAFLFPFIAPGTFWFQFFVELAALCFFILIILKPTYLPRLNRVTIIFSLFFVAQILLVFFSVEPLRSFMGSAERMDGVWNLLHYYLFIIIALSLEQQGKRVKNLVAFSLIVSVLVSLRYILSSIGFPLGYFTFSFGNPGFFANYILLHIPLAVWIFITSNNREQKIALLLLILMHSAVIIHSGNRATFLAWLIGAVLLIGYFAFSKKRLRALLVSVILILILGFGTLISLRDASFIKEFGFLQKITSWSLNDPTIEARLTMWNMAWRGIIEKPIFGWGRENFRIVFDRHYDPGSFVFDSQEQWTDRAHNVVLDELVVGGFTNVLIEISLILLVVWVLLKSAIFYPEKRTFVAIFCVLIFMNFIQTFFTLNTIGTYLPFSLAIFVIFAEIPTKNQYTVKEKYARIFGFLSLPLFVVGIILYSLFPFLANYNVAQSLYIFPKNFSAFSERYKKVDSLLSDKNPYKADIMSIAGMTFSGKANKYLLDPRFPPFQDLMLEKLSLVVEQNPLFSRLKTDYAFNLTLKAELTKHPKDIQNSIRAWEQLMSELPLHQFIKMGATGAYIVAGDNIKTINIIYEIINGSKKTGGMYWDSALVLRKAGKEKEAADFFTEALKLGYVTNDIVHIVLVGNFLVQFPDKIPFARDLYLMGLAMYPTDPNLHANLAYIYGKLGEKKLAIKEAGKALLYAPEHKADIEKFIKSLDSLDQ